jgi:hypothetical protein
LAALQVLVGLNKRDARCFDMYRLDISSGQMRLDTENPGGVFMRASLVPERQHITQLAW